jgi:PleD family two-component response regulator
MSESDLSMQDSVVAGDQDDVGMHSILIVEDEISTAEMLTAYFTSLGYKVTHAGWGHDAVNLATKIQPDLIILDIHLPDIDGYEVCLRLRNQVRTEHIPIIFLTERRERVDRLTGLELGAIDYITKPFDVQELRFRVRNSLQRTSRETLLHPITGLPTSILVEEEVARVTRDADLALIGVRILGMPEFSEAYGFVTHDDVLRAVALILRNTATESLRSDLFVGQLDLYEYLIVAPTGQDSYVVMGRLDQRLNEAASFFYPHRDWERGQRGDGQDIPRLRFTIKLLPVDSYPSAGTVSDIRKLLGNLVEI